MLNRRDGYALAALSVLLGLGPGGSLCIAHDLD